MNNLFHLGLGLMPGDHTWDTNLPPLPLLRYLEFDESNFDILLDEGVADKLKLETSL